MKWILRHSSTKTCNRGSYIKDIRSLLREGVSLLAWTCMNSKKNARTSQTYFWYLWGYLSWPQVKNFFNCLATRWRHHHFCWKLEFWDEIFFWWILLGKKLPLEYFGSILCPKMGLKCSKTFTHLVAKSFVKQFSFWAF